MKRVSPILGILMLLSFASTLQAESPQQAYNEGVALYKKQDYAAALEKFNRVLKVSPSYVYARNYAIKCRQAIADNKGPKNTIESQLAKITVPEINLTDAPIGDVLTYLASRAEELSGGKVVPNFVFEGTAEQRDNSLITLKLRNSPMTVIIGYVGRLGHTRIRYDDHAVVVTPLISQQASSSTQGTNAATEEKSGNLFGEPVKRVFE